MNNSFSQNISHKIQQIMNDLMPYNPEKVFLYGSYARGEAGEDSDIDLLIIKKTNKPKWQRGREVDKLIYKKQYLGDEDKFPGPVDIQVYTPQELAARQQMGDFFITEIMNQGKTIYEKT